MMEWGVILTSLELSLITVVVLLLIAIPLAYWLTYTTSRSKPFVEAVVSLPLVLPPTVLGFYLLLLMSPQSTVGSFFYDTLGLRLAFSFPGIVIGSVIYSLPFMVQPLHTGFAAIPDSLKEASFVLGKSRWQTVLKVILPNSKKAILTGIILTFAHTLGEFGVVLMIGGNIPDQTKVVSIAIFEEVESLNYSVAHLYSGVLLCFSFITLFFVYWNNQRSHEK